MLQKVAALIELRLNEVIRLTQNSAPVACERGPVSYWPGPTFPGLDDLAGRTKRRSEVSLQSVKMAIMETSSSDMSGSSSPGVGGPAGKQCYGCGSHIHDRFYLLAAERQWHTSCLRCCHCKVHLDNELSCFARSGAIYCKDDYYR